jgi:hypothetical protein
MIHTVMIRDNKTQAIIEVLAVTTDEAVAQAMARLYTSRWNSTRRREWGVYVRSSEPFTMKNVLTLAKVSKLIGE